MNRFYVGQEVSVEKKFSKSDVEEFAEITGDNNPLHINEEYAKKSRFKGTIVHGVLVSGLISKLIGTQLPGKGSIYMEQNAQFRKPVYIGQKVVAKVKIIEIDEAKNIFKLETNVYDEDGNCVIRGSAKVLFEE